MDSFFHCCDFYAVLNSGFVNDCYKNCFFRVMIEFAKVHHFFELANYFSTFKSFFSAKRVISTQ